MHEAENATDAKVRYKGKVGHVNKKFIELKGIIKRACYCPRETGGILYKFWPFL